MLILTAFGAVPDDSSPAARVANATAWLAAMAEMVGPAPGLDPRGDTLVISGGEFFFPGPVFMTRGCTITGAGGSVNSFSMLRFPFNGAGIVADSMTSPDAPGSAAWGKIENLDIFNEGPGSIVQRRPGWTYAPGDIVVSPGRDDLMFKCTFGGVTGGPQALFDDAFDGDTLVEADSGTTWLATQRTPLTISKWKPKTTYHVGDIVISTGFHRASRHYGDNRFTYVCMVEGESGEADPFGSQQLDTTVTEPTGVVWRVNAWSAVVMRASIQVDNLTTYLWPNAAIHVNSGVGGPPPAPPLTNANNFVITNLKSTHDGMGIYVFGANANAGFIGYSQVIGPGSFMPGDGGHGLWDHSEGGCLWIGNYVEDGSGAGWISESQGYPTWVNNTSEMTTPNIVLQGNVTSLGGSPWHPTMQQQLSHFGNGTSRFIGTTDSTSRVTVSTQRGIQGFIDAYFTTDEQGNVFNRVYNHDSSRRGWYSDYLTGQPTVFIGGVSGVMADEGPGHPWTGAGTFVGDTNKRYVGFDWAMWEAKRLREGQRRVGDIFIRDAAPAPGGWMGVVVTKQGTKGYDWEPNRDYSEKLAGLFNLPADIVEPGDGFAYACTRSGWSGGPGARPPFADTVTIGVNAPVWRPLRRYWPGSMVRPLVSDGHAYRMKVYPSWTPNTAVAANQIITTGDGNGNLFFAYVQAWAPGVPIQVGWRMQPRVPDGRVFRVKRASNDAPFGSTGPGPDQPDWSLLVLPGDELQDGNIFWQIEQLMTGASEPPGDNPALQGWDTQPGNVTYDNNIEWHFFVPQTGETEPLWNTAASSETEDAPGAKVTTSGAGGITIDAGFGVIWVESGPDPADSKVLDNECEWTRIDTVPDVANVFPLQAAPTAPLTLEMVRLSLTNVDDAAGRWQFEGGQILRAGEHIGDYASTKRSVTGGTTAQNTAMLTVTLFLIGEGEQPAENITLQGSHHFGSGDESGSVSASSASVSSYVGKQFKRSGTALVIG